MKTQPPPELYGSTIFCDEIRHEISGKAIFIGVYTQVMVVNAFPVTLPTFSFFVRYAQRKDLAKEEAPKIKIFLPGDAEDKPSIEGELPYLKSDPNHPLLKSMESILSPGDPLYLNLVGQFSFAPLVIKQPGAIRVRAVRGDELIRIGALAVLGVPNPQPETPVES
jgi:hypothetical protein